MADRIHPAIQRVLDVAERKGVSLEITVFDESTHTAEEAAATVGADLGQIVKSLVFVAPDGQGGLEPVICLISGQDRVDLARLAAVTGEPAIRRATAREARDLTGFSIGGIPPIGHGRPVRVIMDRDLGRWPIVWAAAGTDTAVFPVAPGTLRALSNATVVPIADEAYQDERRRAAEREANAEGTESGATTAASAPDELRAPLGIGPGDSTAQGAGI